MGARSELSAHSLLLFLRNQKFYFSLSKVSLTSHHQHTHCPAHLATALHGGHLSGAASARPTFAMLTRLSHSSLKNQVSLLEVRNKINSHSNGSKYTQTYR